MNHEFRAALRDALNEYGVVKFFIGPDRWCSTTTERADDKCRLMISLLIDNKSELIAWSTMRWPEGPPKHGASSSGHLFSMSLDSPTSFRDAVERVKSDIDSFHAYGKIGRDQWHGGKRTDGSYEEEY